jgi:hypothetical protein
VDDHRVNSIRHEALLPDLRHLGRDAGAATFNGVLAVLPGDANDDGVVSARDVLLVTAEWAQIIPPTIFGNINRDGVVDAFDVLDVIKGLGTKLRSG